MKNFKFIILCLILTLTLTVNTSITFAASNDNLYASWECTYSFYTSDDEGYIDIYDDLYSVPNAWGDGYSTRESDFELHAGDVIKISVYSESLNGEIPDSNSNDHFISVYCGDNYIGSLNTSIINSDFKSDSITINVPERAISSTGKNNLKFEYQINNFYLTSTCIQDIYINGKYLYSR